MINTVEVGGFKDLKRAISVYTGQDGRILANRISVQQHVTCGRMAGGPLVLSFSVGLLSPFACLHIFRWNGFKRSHVTDRTHGRLSSKT